MTDRNLRTLSDTGARGAKEMCAHIRAAMRADGACLVRREGDYCAYLAEDAIAPLWSGQRFLSRACLSGWVMSNRLPVAVADITIDVRIPQDVYRATFVRSLVMAPLLSPGFSGAIAAYWSARGQRGGELTQLSRLADSFLNDDRTAQLLSA